MENVFFFYSKVTVLFTAMHSMTIFVCEFYERKKIFVQCGTHIERNTQMREGEIGDGDGDGGDDGGFV